MRPSPASPPRRWGRDMPALPSLSITNGAIYERDDPLSRLGLRHRLQDRR